MGGVRRPKHALAILGSSEERRLEKSMYHVAELQGDRVGRGIVCQAAESVAERECQFLEFLGSIIARYPF